MVLAASPVIELVNTPRPDASLVWLPAIVGFAVVLQQTPLAETAAPPSEITFPPAVAVVIVMDEAGVVVTTAAHGTNVISLPLLIPSEFTATKRKW